MTKLRKTLRHLQSIFTFKSAYKLFLIECLLCDKNSTLLCILDTDRKAFFIFCTLWLISNRKSAAVRPEIGFLAPKWTFQQTLG